MKPSIATSLEIVVLNNSRYPEDKFEFNLTPKEAKELSEYINRGNTTNEEE